MVEKPASKRQLEPSSERWLRSRQNPPQDERSAAREQASRSQRSQRTSRRAQPQQPQQQQQQQQQRQPRRQRAQAAAAAPPITAGGVDTLRDALAERSEPPNLQVISLHRFMLDPTWHAETGVQVTSACGDAFDVVLSDGAHILKVVLSTALNELVYSGRLEPRGVVTVRGWEARADERALSASAPDLIVVTQLEPVAAPAAAGSSSAAPAAASSLVLDDYYVASERDGLTFAVAEPAAGAAPLARPHREPLPLAGRRRHYLKLRSDEVELTRRWAARAAPENDDGGGGGGGGGALSSQAEMGTCY